MHAPSESAGAAGAAGAIARSTRWPARLRQRLFLFRFYFSALAPLPPGAILRDRLRLGLTSRRVLLGGGFRPARLALRRGGALDSAIETAGLSLRHARPGVRASQIHRVKLALQKRELLAVPDRSRLALVRFAAFFRRPVRHARVFAPPDRRALRARRLVDLVVAQLSQRIERIPRRTHGRRRGAYRTHWRTGGCEPKMKIAMLHARVCDPLGPRWVRFLQRCLGIGLVPLPIAFFMLIYGEATDAAALFLPCAVVLAVRYLIATRAPVRHAELAVDEDGIDIRRAGLLRQRIDAADVVGASTARTESGVTLALVRRFSKGRPLLLDLESDDDLDEVRAALHIGHFGFGEISWPVGVPHRHGAFAAAAVLATFAAAVVALDVESPASALALSAAVVPTLFAYVIFVMWSLANPAPKPRVALTRHGLLLAEPSATITYQPYANVLDAKVTAAHGVYVETDSHPLSIPMHNTLAEEREHLVAQLHSAARRARGEGPQPMAVPASVAILAPHGKPDREWLERLDATAAALSSPSAAHAYRRPDLDAEDLAQALASPDAPAPIRAAAARVLARIAPEEASVQIARALEHERDEDTRALLRVAVEEDVETAARVLDGWRSGGIG
jgi:hypothetical protein